MLRHRLAVLFVALAVSSGAVLPASHASAQECSCAPGAGTDSSLVFRGTAVGRVGKLLEGPAPLDEWSFVTTEVYRGEMKVEQFVATAAEGCDRIDFERDQTYVVFGEQIPSAELPVTTLPLSVIRADGCATTTDLKVIAELGLVAAAPDEPAAAIAGAGISRPASDDDNLQPLTVLIFGGGFLLTAWVVYVLWRKPAADDPPPT